MSCAGSSPVSSALPVVRQHGDRGRRHRIARDPQQALGQPRLDRRVLLAVGAQQVLAGGEVARLQRGDAAALHQQPRFDVGLAADQAGQVRAGLVVAHHGDEGHRRAERGEVADDVAGTARHGHFTLDRQDGHRGLGADALHRAIDVAVQHDIAHHQHTGAAEQTDGGGQTGVRVGGVGLAFRHEHAVACGSAPRKQMPSRAGRLRARRGDSSATRLSGERLRDDTIP